MLHSLQPGHVGCKFVAFSYLSTTLAKPCTCQRGVFQGYTASSPNHWPVPVGVYGARSVFQYTYSHRINFPKCRLCSTSLVVPLVLLVLSLEACLASPNPSHWTYIGISIVQSQGGRRTGPIGSTILTHQDLVLGTHAPCDLQIV